MNLLSFQVGLTLVLFQESFPSSLVSSLYSTTQTSFIESLRTALSAVELQLMVKKVRQAD